MLCCPLPFLPCSPWHSWRFPFSSPFNIHPGLVFCCFYLRTVTETIFLSPQQLQITTRLALERKARLVQERCICAHGKSYSSFTRMVGGSANDLSCLLPQNFRGSSPSLPILSWWTGTYHSPPFHSLASTYIYHNKTHPHPITINHKMVPFLMRSSSSTTASINNTDGASEWRGWQQSTIKIARKTTG